MGTGANRSGHNMVCGPNPAQVHSPANPLPCRQPDASAANPTRCVLTVRTMRAVRGSCKAAPGPGAVHGPCILCPTSIDPATRGVGYDTGRNIDKR